jgi:hypothetical protein
VKICIKEKKGALLTSKFMNGIWPSFQNIHTLWIRTQYDDQKAMSYDAMHTHTAHHPPPHTHSVLKYTVGQLQIPVLCLKTHCGPLKVNVIFYIKRQLLEKLPRIIINCQK